MWTIILVIYKQSLWSDFFYLTFFFHPHFWDFFLILFFPVFYLTFFLPFLFNCFDNNFVPHFLQLFSFFSDFFMILFLTPIFYLFAQFLELIPVGWIFGFLGDVGYGLIPLTFIPSSTPSSWCNIIMIIISLIIIS